MNRSASASLFQRTDACKSRISSDEFGCPSPVGIVEQDPESRNVLQLADTYDDRGARKPDSINWLLSEWRDTKARKAITMEFMAQAMFNFCVCSAVSTAEQMPYNGILKPLQIVVLHFFILYVLVGGTQPISGGHFNPMVSTMMSVLGELPWKRLPLYIVAQLTGGVLGSASQFFSLPDEIRTAQFAGVQAVPADRAVWQAFIGEAFAAFVLMLVICLYGLDPDARRGAGEHIPLVVAITISFLIYIVGPVSSMCINPARAFGPAVVSGFWEHHWVWWTAPFIGGLAFILPYKALLASHENEIKKCC